MPPHNFSPNWALNSKTIPLNSTNWALHLCCMVDYSARFFPSRTLSKAGRYFDWHRSAPSPVLFKNKIYSATCVGCVGIMATYYVGIDFKFEISNILYILFYNKVIDIQYRCMSIFGIKFIDSILKRVSIFLFRQNMKKNLINVIIKAIYPLLRLKTKIFEECQFCRILSVLCYFYS